MSHCMGPDCPNTLTHADVTRFPPSLCRYESDKPVKTGHLLEFSMVHTRALCETCYDRFIKHNYVAFSYGSERAGYYGAEKRQLVCSFDGTEIYLTNSNYQITRKLADIATERRLFYLDKANILPPHEHWSEDCLQKIYGDAWETWYFPSRHMNVTAEDARYPDGRTGGHWEAMELDVSRKWTTWFLDGTPMESMYKP